MIPTLNEEHVAEARALLTSAFNGKTVIQGMLDSYIGGVQSLEIAIFDVIELRLLDNATDAQLDTLGALVGETRQGRDDSTYREAIRLRIRVNRSQGRAEDVIQVAKIATDDNFTYTEVFPAGWEVETFDTVAPNTVAHLLGQTKAAGTRGVLVYTMWPFSETFRWASVYGGTDTPDYFGSTYDTFTSRWSAVAECTP